MLDPLSGQFRPLIVFMMKDLIFGWEIDMTTSMLGIDIAKNTFQLLYAPSKF